MNIKLINLKEIAQNSEISICKTTSFNKTTNIHCMRIDCDECVFSQYADFNVKSKLTKAFNNEY